MSLKKLLKRLTRALPVIVANAPAVIDAVKQVKDALKAPEAPGGAARPAPLPGPGEP